MDNTQNDHLKSYGLVYYILEQQNNVEWFNKLGDCDKQSFFIENDDNQKKYNIAIVPTIVIFDDGEEVKRYQADLSFTMVTTRKEIQDYIDELIISKF